MSVSINYRYRPDGLLPDATKLPDIPLLNLVFVRRDRRQALLASAVVDTGFDGPVYANLELAEFLEALVPLTRAALDTAGHRIDCEVFKVECHLADTERRPKMAFGQVDVYVPVQPADLTPDVLVGRTILNRLTLQLDGSSLQVRGTGATHRQRHG